MIDIFIYICIILFAAILTRKKFFPKFILDKTPFLQNFSLCILLGTMGFKIGADKNLVSNLHILGLKSFTITVFAILFTIIFIKIIYGGEKK